MAEVEYKRVLKAVYEDMSNYHNIFKIYKKDKADLPTVVEDENGNLVELYKIDISPKVQLKQDDSIIIYISVGNDLYTLVNVYHIAYTLETDNIQTMFCFSDGMWKSRTVCVDSEYNLIRNDFKYCLVNELTMPRDNKKKKRRSFKKY